MKANTASILSDYANRPRGCASCGWPVIHACCNDEFTKYKDAKEFDYWYYCSNKGCVNHSGEGVFQDNPDWVQK